MKILILTLIIYSMFYVSNSDLEVLKLECQTGVRICK